MMIELPRTFWGWVLLIAYFALVDAVFDLLFRDWWLHRAWPWIVSR